MRFDDNARPRLYKSLEMDKTHSEHDQATRFAELLSGLAVREGKQPTSVPGVEVSRTSYPTTGTPVVYEPMILLITSASPHFFLCTGMDGPV